MKLYIRRLVEFGGFALGLVLLRPSGPIDRYYVFWYSTLNKSTQDSFPAHYDGLIFVAFMIIWVMISAYIIYMLEKPRDYSQYFVKFHPKFFQDVAKLFEIYINDRIHELERNTLESFLNDARCHEAAIISTLYALRESLIIGYNPDNVRITLMIPQLLDEGEEPKLYIEYWANESRKTPITRKQGIGFREGEGYAGYAWKVTVPQIGRKRKFLLIDDVRYVETSKDQETVKSFCSIPIFDEGPTSGARPLLAVINIDATKYFYFPSNKRKIHAFVRSIRPFIILIHFHLVYRDRLLEKSSG